MNRIKKQQLRECYTKLTDILESMSYDPAEGIISEDIMAYGTAVDERMFSLKDFISQLKTEKNLSGGKSFSIKRNTVFEKYSEDENTAVIVGEFNIKISDKGETHELNTRCTSVIEYLDLKWKVVHVHMSKVDEEMEIKDPWHLNLLKKRNEELEKTVTERTTELERKNKELLTEASLERVRSSAMAMHNSDELSSTIKIFFNELKNLGVMPWRCGVGRVNKETKTTNLTTTSVTKDGNSIIVNGMLKQEGHPVLKKIYDNWMLQKEYYPVLKGKDIKAYYKVTKTQIAFPDYPGDSEQYGHFFYFKEGFVFAWTVKKLSEEKLNIFRRFSIVLSLTFRRYLDIKESEAQARESKIETALERVRSRTMGMQKSKELKEVIQLVFEQFVQLNINIGHTGFIIDYKARDDMHIWLADREYVPSEITIPYFDCPHWNSFNLAKKKKLNFFANHHSFEEKNIFYKKLFKKIPGIPEKVQEFYFNCPGLDISTVLLDNVGLYIENFSGVPYTNEENAILMRLGKVFQQTYTRFLDLQKAEAQAREAQIEASLERVRSKAIAMQRSEDLAAAVTVVFEEMDKLKLETSRCGIGIIEKERRTVDVWAIVKTKEGYIAKLNAEVLMDVHPLLQGAYNAWVKQEDFSYMLEGKKITEYYKALEKEKFILPDPIKSGQEKEIKMQYYFVTTFQAGGLFAFNDMEFSEEAKSVLKRFADVFNFTYMRFLDLQKAEAQAKEARIEASLERVRTQAMGMRKSEELSVVSEVIFNELKTLGFRNLRNTEVIINNDEKESVLSYYYSDYGVTGKIEVFYREHPTVKAWAEEMKKTDDAFTVVEITEREIDEWRKYRKKIGYLPDVKLNKAKEVIYYSYSTGLGALSVSVFKKLSDVELKILERFRNVFGLAYRRYSDVALAEAQAHKAQIEAALERVRARALAMQEPEELFEVAKVLRYEMGLLNVDELETASIFIYRENSDKMECWYSLRDTRVDEKKFISDNITIQLKQSETGRKLLKFFESGETRIKLFMSKEERKEWIEYCFSLSPQLKEFYAENIPERIYHMHKFSDGAVAAISEGDISEESWELLKRAASVFTLAYSRYKDLMQARTDLQLLKEEKKRSDSLLLNILPEEIAAELKEFGKSYARKHDEVTVMFADIRGFSKIAEMLTPSELVTQLDECFRAFDYIVEKHGLEKIKTIGDAYVCACGLPKPVDDHAVKAVRAALDMMEFIKGFSMTKKIQDLPEFEFRIGIHTGPVITGVVGLKKFTYDIWGDAVNMAARMEQHGESGKINISESTYRFVKDKFKCIPRGAIEAKNKGMVEMYFVQ